ncbi:MAG: spore coat protein CotJB [Clostridia bacterium]
MSDKQAQKRKIDAYKFASWELHLFLDSHPENCEAARKQSEYQKMITKLTKEYESQYGSLAETSDNSSRYEWINSPWPWEIEE